MKYVRFMKDTIISYGILEEEKIQVIKGDIFNEFEITNEVYHLSEVKLLHPCTPSKIVCVGLNYRDHAEEMKDKLPTEPIIFIKPDRKSVV